MCKIMIMGGVNKDNRPKAIELIKEMAKEMSPGNKDGLGYAAIDSKGNLFGERWLDNSSAFNNVDVVSQFGEAIDGCNGEYNKFGEPNLDDLSAITLHTRMATSAKGMSNTHPFHYPEDDTSLIHNGVIDNDKDFKLKVSTCDSEAILQAYLINQVNYNPVMVNEMAKMLYGYYAVGVFSRDENGNRIMDIFKGNHASLIISYVYELGTYVFTTSEMDLTSACRKLNLTMSKAFSLKEGFLLRVDPFTSKVLYKEKFTVQSRFKQYNNYTSYNGVHNRGETSLTDEGNTVTKAESDFKSNIIDVSTIGARERKSKSNEEVLAMMSLIPNIKEYTEGEVREMGMACGFWARE